MGNGSLREIQNPISPAHRLVFHGERTGLSLLLLFWGFLTLIDQCRGKGVSCILETGDQGAEFFDGSGVFRVIDLVGPFVGILGGVVNSSSLAP